MLFYVMKYKDFTLTTSLNSSYIKAYVVLLFLSILLIFQSVNFEAAFRNILQLTGVLLTSIILLELINLKHENITEWLYICFVFGFYISLYFLDRSLSKETSIESRWIDREQFDLNANTYSYYAYISLFSLFFLIEIYKRKIYIFLSIFTLIISVYISFITASRSGFVFPIFASVVYWVFIYKPSSQKLYPILKFLIIVVGIYFSVNILRSTFEDSYLQNRINRSNELGDSRWDIALDALNVFAENPFNGVGPAQFSFYAIYAPGKYSHNSYLEAGSNLGILGFFIVFMMFLIPIFQSLKIQTRNNSLKYLLILFFSTFFVYNLIYVFYWSVVEMMFFFFACHQLKLLNQQRIV